MPREAETQQNTVNSVDNYVYNYEFEVDNYLIADPVNVQIAYDNWIKEEAIKQKIEQAKKDTTFACNCVLWIKNALKIPIPQIGVAKNLKPNVDHPEAGFIVITNESLPGTDTGHVAFIEKTTNSDFKVIEAHFNGCTISERSIPINSPKIIGYYRQNN